jgi:hypothetical protein
MPSRLVAFFEFTLFICFDTKSFSISWNINLGISFLFSLPVSILPTISKFYERAIYEQIVTFFDKVFHPFLSAFRSGYGCQTALLKIIKDWKKALDENEFVAAILVDLYMSSQSLIILPILTHCFLLER